MGTQPKLSPLRRFPRGLRFRLTLSYVVFFGVFLFLLGLSLRRGLDAVLEARMKETVEEEWGAVKGYLRIEKNKPIWFYDSEDPEEAAIVERLRRVLLLTDLNGNVLEVSNGYRALGVEEPEQITRIVRSRSVIWKTKSNSQGNPYLLRYGILVDGKRSYFLGVGRGLMDDQAVVERFMRGYYTLAPVVLALSLLVGWFAAGGALRPLKTLARTAEEITSSRMDLRIPLRQSGDELDHLIETFNGMMGRLSEGFEQIRRFSTDVSHELRTPLTAMRGQLEVAVFTAKTTDQFRDAMLNALQDVERLTQVVNSLLMLSRAESGQLTLARTPVDIAEIATAAVELFQIPAEEAQVDLCAELTPGTVVEGDRVQLERLLNNLLSNAVKYTPAGGSVKVSVRGAEGPAGDEIELAVEDTGRGIPEEARQHIFDRFYRVAGEPDPHKGLGLGLSFVAWIVKAHGGRIDVTSEVGRGSRFVVRIPARTGISPDDPVEERRGRSRPYAGSVE